MFQTIRNLLVLPLVFFLTKICLAQNTSPLSGSWQTICDRGLRKEQFIEGNSVTTTEFFHQDRLCNQESFRFRTAGLVAFEKDQPQWINFTYTKIELTVFVPEVAKDFNSRAVCGFQDWQARVSKEITGLPCALFNVNKPTQIPAVGNLRFGIYMIENEKLYYGLLTKEKNGSSPQTRPEIYSPEFYTRK